jgi:cysteine synthase
MSSLCLVGLIVQLTWYTDRIYNNMRLLTYGFAALEMLRQVSAADKRIVEASSGSTVLSLGILSRVLWGNRDVTAFVTNKKSPESLRLLRFFGLKV